jgi:hypothetical protein
MKVNIRFPIQNSFVDIEEADVVRATTFARRAAATAGAYARAHPWQTLGIVVGVGVLGYGAVAALGGRSFVAAAAPAAAGIANRALKAVGVAMITRAADELAG